ncbi:endonuclease/exonuclease/phosphatase family protein [Ochrovirga pacifica]|uniref:endonuclease/exonuclease/phosphatase family protein n=1 Tax=Ochrovirga pacifica TaxID=1042376 RepID=UPI000255A7B1|nr:endonuclease/exonuclease/phosphatase family protein [Ochrovirga pacifica]
MKKKLNLLEKLAFFLNIVVAVVLCIVYAIPYLDPHFFPYTNLLSLSYPLFLAINLFFVLFWLLRLRIQFLFSLLVIGLGYQQITSFFSLHGKEVLKQSDIQVLSYNVRQFNKGRWIQSPTITQELFQFINQQKADLVCIQEYHAFSNHKVDLPYAYTKRKNANELAIFSRYPILNKGSLNFKNTTNNVIYVDVKIHGETIRIYNLHIESFRLNTQQEHYGDATNEALLKRFKRVFIKQSEQINELKAHIDACPYRSIVAGDTNNTSFSWNYHHLIKGRKDAFVEAGTGFGSTFNYLFPLRIDFILPDETMNIGSFTNFDVKLSDHFPIMARIDLNN